MHGLQHSPVGLFLVPLAQGSMGLQDERTVPVNGHGDSDVDHALQHLQRRALYSTGRSSTPGGASGATELATDFGMFTPSPLEHAYQPKW